MSLEVELILKICINCKNEKALSSFYKKARGLRIDTTCKKCRRTEQRSRYKTHPSKPKSKPVAKNFQSRIIGVLTKQTIDNFGAAFGHALKVVNYEGSVQEANHIGGTTTTR